jgi:hypothetical protein
VRDGPALSRYRRDIGTVAEGGRLPLLPLKRPAWSLFWCSRPRGIGVGTRRTLEDPVETVHHSLRIIGIIATIIALILIGGFFFRLPPLPGLCSTRL